MNKPDEILTITTVTRILPYALMAFVGVAGWSMDSVALLAIVVLGTMGVAIGTAMVAQKERQEEQAVDLTSDHETAHHEGYPPQG